eukprot:TRINITY_DN1650_c0_g1_i10.p1 TRINITY_DN1650_c0_g1~~TRINITY_DN1650_c0_g1_i10.p1  ORF type:complete len:343 (-),score=73.35 TRINITY_DN1650_c0_g1_i10:74-1102(-)
MCIRDSINAEYMGIIGINFYSISLLKLSVSPMTTSANNNNETFQGGNLLRQPSLGLNSPLVSAPIYSQDSLSFGSQFGMNRTMNMLPGYSSMFQDGMTGMGGMNGAPLYGPMAEQRPDFRSEYQGVLRGLQSVLEILYATTGIINFGGLVVKMTFRALRFIFGGSMKMMNFLLEVSHFKHLLRLLVPFYRKQENLTTLWKDAAPELLNDTPRSSRILFVLRVLSLLVLVVGYVLKKRSDAALEKLRKTEEEASTVVEETEVEPSIQVERQNEEVLNKQTSEEFWSIRPAEKIDDHINTARVDYPFAATPLPELSPATEPITDPALKAKPWLKRMRTTSANLE